MSRTTIKTYNDMCAERERLQNLLAFQKKRVADDWDAFKDGLSPVKNVFGVVGKMAKGDKSNPLVTAGLNIASDLFLKNFVLAKAGWVTKLAIPFVMKNYSSHFLSNTGKGFFSKLGSLFSRRPRHHSSKNEDHAGEEKGS